MGLQPIEIVVLLLICSLSTIILHYTTRRYIPTNLLENIKRKKGIVFLMFNLARQRHIQQSAADERGFCGGL